MIIYFVVFLTSCASVSMLGQPMKEVVVADSTFRVYMRSGSQIVEVHRVSFEPLPSRILVLVKAARAIEIATGCGIQNGSLEGDQAIIKARVDCVLL
jgi:hypothetical protein